MRVLSRVSPQRLRNQMRLMAIPLVIMPTLPIGYIVEIEGRSAVLTVGKALRLGAEKVNVNGGAIALSHPTPRLSARIVALPEPRQDRVICQWITCPSSATGERYLVS